MITENALRLKKREENNENKLENYKDYTSK